MIARIIFFIGYVAIFTHGAAAGECEKLPDNMDIENCCKFPDLSNNGTMKKIVEQFKDQKLDDFMLECKITEAMFNEMKLIKDNSIDKDAMLKYLDSQVKEASWKPVMKESTEECYKDIVAKKDEIVKELEKAPFNIKKDQCNVIFMSMVTCIHLEGFESCPKEFWNTEKKCIDVKAWIEKCGDNIESLRQLVAKRVRK